MEQPDGAVVRQTDVVGHFERGEDAGVQVVVAVRVEVKQREVLPDGERMLRGVLRLAELPAERREDPLLKELKRTLAHFLSLSFSDYFFFFF